MEGWQLSSLVGKEGARKPRKKAHGAFYLLQEQTWEASGDGKNEFLSDKFKSVGVSSNQIRQATARTGRVFQQPIRP